MQNIMKTPRVPVKGLGYLKTFFGVNVGVKLSIEFCPKTRIYRWGHSPYVPRFENTCSVWLGYLGKVKSLP